MKKIKSLSAVLAFTGFVSVAAISGRASAAIIDVQFDPGNAGAQSGAAVLGSAGDIWNNLTGGTGAAVVLNDVTGTATSVKLTWTENFGGLNAAGSPMDAGTTNLMQGYGGFNGTTLAITGLTPSTNYQLALYGAGDQAAGDQGTKFTIPQTGPSVVGTTTETFAATGDRKLSDGAGVAYTLLSASSDASGNMSINIAFNSSHFSTAPVNGLQIASAAVPEPASLGLLGMSAVTLIGRRRRR